MEQNDDIVRTVYGLLVNGNPVPVDAERIAAASRVAGPRAPWSTVRAMARAAADPHTMLVEPTAGRGCRRS